MKKVIIASTSFLALLLVLSGCAKSSQNANQAVQKNSNKPGQMRQPDFGQPNRQPDVRGIVKTIVGNEVVVLKIEMPNSGASSTPNQAQGETNGTAAPSINITGGQGGGMMGAGGSGGGPGGPGGGPGGPGGQTSDSRAQMLERLKEMSTGEEKIIIPVGIQMLKIDTSDNERTMVEATLADITVDKNITIWTATSTASTATGTTTNAVERKIAEFVLIN